jgi:hypothetical protein
MKLILTGVLAASTLAFAAPAFAQYAPQDQGRGAMQPDNGGRHDSGYGQQGQQGQQGYGQQGYGQDQGRGDQMQRGGDQRDMADHHENRGGFGDNGDHGRSAWGHSHHHRQVCTWRHHRRICRWR